MSITEAKKAAKARLKQACAHSALLDLHLTEIKEGAVTMEERMPKIRVLLGLLAQDIHEFNAYHNVVTTGK